MSAVKDDAKMVVQELFGPISARRLDRMDDSNPIFFLNQVKDMISAMLGPKAAEQKLAPLYAKYK